MLEQTLRKKAIERIKELNDSLRLRGNDIIHENYKLIKVMDTKGYQTAIIQAQWGFVIMQTKNGLSNAVKEIWLTDSEFNVMVLSKVKTLYQYGKSKPSTNEREAFSNWFKDTFEIKPQDIDLETYG